MSNTGSRRNLRIAIIHDWLAVRGGAEKVAEELLQAFPSAELFSLVDLLPARERGFLGPRHVNTSFLQRMPGVGRHYRSYLPLMPLAVERFDLSGFDLVISNCHAVAKGVRTSARQLHISYVHTPIRYAWDMQQEYLELNDLRGVRGGLARALLAYIRRWDRSAARRPDRLLASSEFAARRIDRAYARPSTVIYPPVKTHYYQPNGRKDDFYLAASRLVAYKRIDLIVEAFRRMPGRRLVVIGDGPEAAKLRDRCGDNITWLGYQPDAVLRDHLQRARAFLFAAREDFGILPVEAQACGTPVIAFAEGGAAETVRGPETEAPTGVFFPAQSVEAICSAVEQFEQLKDRFSSAACRRNAERFSVDRFQREFQEFTSAAWQTHRDQPSHAA